MFNSPLSTNHYNIKSAHPEETINYDSYFKSSKASTQQKMISEKKKSPGEIRKSNRKVLPLQPGPYFVNSYGFKPEESLGFCFYNNTAKPDQENLSPKK